MAIEVVGLDLAKNVFQVHGVDEAGRAVLRKKLRRSEVLPLFAKLEPAVVGMEACHTAHYWAREIAALGHRVQLMPPQFVKPYVKSQKNDAADVDGKGEERDHRRPVPPPGLAMAGYLRPQAPAAKASRAASPASASLAR